MSIARKLYRGLLALCAAAMTASAPAAAQQQKRPNVVMLMTDDTGWGDFGYMPGGGRALGHPTPNIDRIAAEGAVFTNWYGQASCTAGRASFNTGRIPIRTALSIVVAHKAADAACPPLAAPVCDKLRRDRSQDQQA